VVNAAKIEALIRNMRRFTGYLAELATVELSDFLSDFDQFVAYVLDFIAQSATGQ
jgi:hypothetical protein